MAVAIFEPINFESVKTTTKGARCLNSAGSFAFEIICADADRYRAM
ncbi:hypothetical protein [Acidihalobacter ferrooxydans]|nr:hypothetical protein [Acidihalobacter ferrooxydans]